MRGALTISQASKAMVLMSYDENWRKDGLMDLMIDLMSDWEVPHISLVLSNIPKALINIDPEKYTYVEENENQPDQPEEAPDEPQTENNQEKPSDAEIDFMHPSSLWGYKAKVERLENEEEHQERLITPISSLSYEAGSGHTVPEDSQDGNKELMLSMPYKPHGVEWFPDEIGALIGRLFAEEWELDHITYLLTDLATVHYAQGAENYHWEDYLGYMGIILASSMSVNRHWENEDIMWVYKDFAIDVGKWSLRKWYNPTPSSNRSQNKRMMRRYKLMRQPTFSHKPKSLRMLSPTKLSTLPPKKTLNFGPEFRELEYREWLADIISLAAIRRDDEDHDSKLINSIMEETCEAWDYERGDYLGYMIEARMKKRRDVGQMFRFPIKQANSALATLGFKKNVSTPVQGRSFLWVPPPEYYIKEKWEAEHARLSKESQERCLEQRRETENRYLNPPDQDDQNLTQIE